MPKHASGEILRAAERFALLGAAGELATKWGLTGWKKGEVKRTTERLFREWLETRATKAYHQGAQRKRPACCSCPLGENQAEEGRQIMSQRRLQPSCTACCQERWAC